MGTYIIYSIVYSYALAFYVLVKGNLGFALFLLTLFLFAALRGDVGADTCAYQEIYNLFNLRERELDFGRIEPLFALLNIVLNFMGFGHQSIFVVVAGLQTLIYLKIHQYANPNTKWLLAFVVLIYYYSFYFNTIRYGLAVIAFSYAFILHLEGRDKLATIVAILSIGIHIAAAPLMLLMRGLAVRYIAVAAGSLYLYNSFIDTDLIVSKLEYVHYLLEYDYEFRASVDWFIVRSLTLLVVIIFLVRSIYYKFLFIFFILGVGTLDALMPVIGRFSEAYVFILLIYLSYTGVDRRKLFYLYPFLFLSIYSHIAYPIINGDSILKESRLSQGMSDIASGVKYHFFFESDKLVCK